MRRLLSIILLLCGGVVAQSYTPNLNLTLPVRGALNWDTAVNGNSTIIDTYVGTLQIYKGTWGGSTVYGSGQMVLYGGALYSSLVGSNFNNQPDTHPAQWSVMISSVPASGPANEVFATPDGSSGVPALRALVAADLPSTTLYGTLTPGTIPEASALHGLTDSPLVDGNGFLVMTVPLQFGNGGSSTAGWQWTTSTNSGFFQAGAITVPQEFADNIDAGYAFLDGACPANPTGGGAFWEMICADSATHKLLGSWGGSVGLYPILRTIDVIGDGSVSISGMLTNTGVNGAVVPASAEVAVTNSSGQILTGHTLYFGTTEVTVTNLKIVAADVIGLASGNNDLYTVPAGKMALVIDALSTNPAASSVTIQCQAQFKTVGGTYVNYDFLTSSGNTSPTYGHQGALLPMLITAGEKWGVNCDNAGLSIWPTIYEFDNTAPLARALISTALSTISAGNNTVYTAAANGSQFIPFISSGSGNLLRGSLFYYNNSGTSRTVSWNLVPNGGSVADANQIFTGTVTAPNASSGSVNYLGGLGTGDFISINVDASTGTQTAFVIYRTLP